MSEIDEGEIEPTPGYLSIRSNPVRQRITRGLPIDFYK